MKKKIKDEDVFLDEMQEEIDKIVEEKKSVIPKYIRWLLSIFIILLLLGWLIPSYYIKANPYPVYAPSLDEVFSFNVNESDIRNKYTDFNQRSQFIGLINDGIFEVKMVADRISSLACNYGDNYQLCQAKAIYFFVRDELEYVQDPVGFNYIKSPLESLYSRGGDCDDAAVLLASLLGAIGIRTRLVFVPRHVYVEAYMPDAPLWYKSYRGQHWITLDATCKNCKFGENTLSNIKFDKQYLDVY